MYYPSICMIGLLLISSLSFAASPDAPVSISSDSASFDEIKGISTYSGNVLLEQGNLKIEASELNVTIKSNKVTDITATGKPVTINDLLDDGTKVSGKGNKVTYKTQNELLVFEGGAAITQGDNKISNDYVEYDIKTGKMKAGGNNATDRVQVILNPSAVQE